MDVIIHRYICCSRLLWHSVISLALLRCPAIRTVHAGSRHRSVLCIFMLLLCFPLTRGVTDVGHGNLSLYCFNSWKWVLFWAEDEISRGSHYQASQAGYYNGRNSHYLPLSFLSPASETHFSFLSLRILLLLAPYLYSLQFLCLTKSHSLPLPHSPVYLRQNILKFSSCVWCPGPRTPLWLRSIKSMRRENPSGTDFHREATQTSTQRS